MKYEYLIFLDTEFVSSLTSKQPLQVGLSVYRYNGQSFVRSYQFSTYILVKRGNRLDRYVKKYTQINEEILKTYGIRYSDARQQLIQFLLDFPFEKTLLIGWDPKNDRTMLNLLLNEKEELLNIHWYDWFDLVNPFKALKGWPSGQTPGLTSACQTFELTDFRFHDAYEDANATGAVFFKLVENYGFDQVIQPQWVIPSSLQPITSK